VNFGLLHYKEKEKSAAAFSWTCFQGAVNLLCDCEMAGWSTDDHLNHIL